MPKMTYDEFLKSKRTVRGSLAESVYREAWLAAGGTIEPPTHTCSTCGFTWLHGQSGSHNCGQVLYAEYDKVGLAIGIDTAGVTFVERRALVMNRIEHLLAIERMKS